MNLDKSKNLSFGKDLSLEDLLLDTKQQKGRLVEIQKICRRQNKHDPKIEICIVVTSIFSSTHNVFRTSHTGSLEVVIVW